MNPEPSALIVNIVFWNEADQIRQRTGKAPAGAGCLSAMLIVQVIVVVLFCLIVMVSGLVSQF
jgi:hypothetical protein